MTVGQSFIVAVSSIASCQLTLSGSSTLTFLPGFALSGSTHSLLGFAKTVPAEEEVSLPGPLATATGCVDLADTFDFTEVVDSAAGWGFGAGLAAAGLVASGRDAIGAEEGPAGVGRDASRCGLAAIGCWGVATEADIVRSAGLL